MQRHIRAIPRYAAIILPLALVALVLVSTAPRHVAAQSATRRVMALPAGLPTHFSFGIADGNGGASYLAAMRAQNGTAWDYHYTYLSAGVNTGHGWATWNSPPGQYAADVMHNDQSNGFLPVFVYYMMLQSTGPTGSGSGEAASDLGHLADPTVMNAYYTDWALLMQKIGANGGAVMVIVEPDLWGYIEQAAANNGSNNAASIPASVASSGYADAQGLPNTAQGFAWTLLHIRDHYAHNALLALHSSSWGTRTDIAGTTDPNVNAAALGTQEGQFLQTAGIVGNPAGISAFDLVSNDIADHDSGQSGYWWDKNNSTFPNFTRYLTFIHALGVAAGRPVMMWQVPAGNQYFDTQNNSTGHTQDNRAEYIIAHIPDFANAGVVGVLFGPGNGGTNVFDNQKDGVTNPAPISTYECNLCNNHQSAYADDDGGYLRLTLAQYYKNGAYPLSGGAFTPPQLPAATTVPATPAPTAGTTPPATTAATQVAVVGFGSTTTSQQSANKTHASTSLWLPLVAALLALAAGAGGWLWWRRRRLVGVSGVATAPDGLDSAPDHWGFGDTSQQARPDVDEMWAPDEAFDAPTPGGAWPTRPPQPSQWRQPGGWE